MLPFRSALVQVAKLTVQRRRVSSKVASRCLIDIKNSHASLPTLPQPRVCLVGRAPHLYFPMACKTLRIPARRRPR
jgi:hypothetical protein